VRLRGARFRLGSAARRRRPWPWRYRVRSVRRPEGLRRYARSRRRAAALRGEPPGVGASPRLVVAPRGAVVPWRAVCSASVRPPGPSTFRRRAVASDCAPPVGCVPLPSPTRRPVVTAVRCPVRSLPSGSRVSFRRRAPSYCWLASGWLLPGRHRVSHRSESPSGCWLAAWSARRGSSGFAACPRRGGGLGPGRCERSFALRGGGGRYKPACRAPPKRRLAGRPAVAGPRGGRCRWVAGPRPSLCRSEEHCRPVCVPGVPAFRRRWVRVWWAISLAVLPRRRAEARRFGCVPAPWGASPFG